MKLNTVNYNTNIYSNRSFGSQTAIANDRNTVSKPSSEKTDNQNKVLIGTAITGGLILLGIVFRKNIAELAKKFFKKEETPKLEPKKPEAPKTEAPKSEIKPPEVELPKFDGQKTLAEYRELLKEQKAFSASMTEEEKSLWRVQDEKRRELLNKLVDNNVSLVEKEEFSSDPTKDIEAKRAYLISSKVNEASFNEASKLDYLEMFDKYGERIWIIEEQGDSSISELSSIIRGNNSDKVMSKYIDIMDRLAQRDNTGMRDAICIGVVFNSNAEKMSKETALKFIKVLKKTSFQQADGLNIELTLKRTPLKEDKEIIEALADYKKSLENFPYEDKTFND